MGHVFKKGFRGLFIGFRVQGLGLLVLAALLPETWAMFRFLGFLVYRVYRVLKFIGLIVPYQRLGPFSVLGFRGLGCIYRV